MSTIVLQDRTDEEIEHDALISHPAYRAGIQMGWRLACAHWMQPMPEEESR